MSNETNLRRIIYVGTGLVIVATIILTFMVIPSVLIDKSPQAAPISAITGILFVIIIHLVIVAALVRTILVNQRSGRIDKGLLIGLGGLILFLSLIVLDGASAVLDHTDPIMHRAAVSMFICSGCNFIASVLAFLGAWYSRRLQPPSK